MRLLIWALVWVFLAFLLTGTATYFLAPFEHTLWAHLLEAASILFFSFSLLMGGVLTTRKNYNMRRKVYYREEWAFICVLVTIILFGISLLIE